MVTSGRSATRVFESRIDFNFSAASYGANQSNRSKALTHDFSIPREGESHGNWRKTALKIFLKILGHWISCKLNIFLSTRALFQKQQPLRCARKNPPSGKPALWFGTAQHGKSFVLIKQKSRSKLNLSRTQISMVRRGTARLIKRALECSDCKVFACEQKLAHAKKLVG